MNKSLLPIILASLMDPNIEKLYDNFGSIEGSGSDKLIEGSKGKVLSNGGDPIKVAIHPGRNEKCKCGSGLKYKRCCGKEDL